MAPRLLPRHKKRSNHDPKPHQNLKTAKASSQTSELELFEPLKNRPLPLALKIAEKAADSLKRRWGLEGSLVPAGGFMLPYWRAPDLSR